MTAISPTAMVLAAGRGTRMRPLSLEKPKPLLEVGGRTMLDHALDKLVASGMERAVVNCFYLAEQIEEHLKQRRDLEIIISRETELLDTGGGIKNALHYFDGKPFFALNAEPPWIDGPEPSLKRMAAMWDAEKMDALLLLLPMGKARNFNPSGDFTLDANGHAHRHDVPKSRSHVWIAAQILKPELYTHVPDKKFSNNLIWDSAEARHRLYGIEHGGSSFDVGTPEDLAEANALLASGRGWL